MKKLTFLFSLVLFSCLNFVSAEELTQFDVDDQISTPMYQDKQVNLIRISPDDNAPFVQMEVPGGRAPTKEEILSKDGMWEKVRLSYSLTYNSAKDPARECYRSGFFKEFVGYRKIIK